MSIKKCADAIDDVNLLREDYYGGSKKSVWYSSISSCIAINLSVPTGAGASARTNFAGFHSTLADTKEEINSALSSLSGYASELGGKFRIAYLIGCTSIYFSKTKNGPKSVYELADMIRARYKDDITGIYYYDLSLGYINSNQTFNVFTENQSTEDNFFSYLMPGDDALLQKNKERDIKPSNRVFIRNSDLKAA